MPFPQPPFNSPVQSEPTIFGVVKIKAVWQNWLQLVQIFLASLTNSGPTSARPTKDLWVGQPFFDTTINVPVYWDGSAWVTSSPSGTVTAVTGTAPIASSGGTTPDISIAQANASTNGYLSSTDWSTFNGKANAFTYTTSYIPFGQGTTTPNQSSSLTYASSTLTAPVVSASNGLVVNSNTVSASYSIPSGSSASSVGPMTVASGQTVTVPSGSRWVVL